jgi:hypothetical protein
MRNQFNIANADHGIGPSRVEIEAVLFGCYDIEGDDRLVDELLDSSCLATPSSEPPMRAPFWA